MQVTIEIDDGGKARKALPIRAIPYVTSWRESPDSIVRTLAAPKTEKYRNGLVVRLRHNELFAYQVDAQGKYEQIPPSQWESWVVTLDSLTKKSQADERVGAENENHASWRIKAVLELPDNVFCWLDEFQPWYSSTRPLICGNSEFADVEYVTPDDDEEVCFEHEDDTLLLTPIFPPEIENKVWRYPKDFEKQPVAITANTIDIEHSGNYQSLRELILPHINKPFDELPEKLREFVKDEFAMPWNNLSAAQRLEFAEQYDCQHDPALNEENKYWWNLYCDIDETKKKITEWELMNHQYDPVKAKIRDDKLHELHAELEVLNKRCNEPFTVKVETEPVATSGSVAQPAPAEKVKAARGIDKRKVMYAFQDIKWDYDHWGKNLSTPPDWLKTCRVARGDKNTSALWNPADIGLALLDKKIKLKKLDAVFVSLNDWADEWREKTTLERD